MEQGIVLKSTGKFYIVRTNNKEIIQCGIKGNFRIKDIDTTNPIAVGDEVTFKRENDNHGVITAIAPRKNYLIRKSIKLSKQYHIIAANVDQAMLIVTVAFPETLQGFIDRFLVSAEAYRLPAIIVFNKTDLYNEQHICQMEEWQSLYESIGYKCLQTSVITNQNIDELKLLLHQKTTVISGNSGVGKSSLINCVDNQLHLKTGAISDAFKTGKHITTFAEMFELSNGGYIIDTPGIRAYGLIDFQKEEMYHFFPEIFKIAENCKFHNCLHLNEPGCAVIEAVEQGEIHPARYNSYLSLVENKDEKYR
jgi:ribosome biogenesis GTPase / thiamine phosphate phosphatase